MLLGLGLLIVGVVLALFGCLKKADGTRFVPENVWTMALYPVTCITFLTFGLALMIAG